MERCTCRCRNSQPLKIDLGPLPVDERAAYVESVCNTLDDSRNDRFWWNTVFLHAGRSGWITGYWTGESNCDSGDDIDLLQLDRRYQPPRSIESRLGLGRYHDGIMQNRSSGEVLSTDLDTDFPAPVTQPYFARGPTAPFHLKSTIFY